MFDSQRPRATALALLLSLLASGGCVFDEEGAAATALFIDQSGSVAVQVDQRLDLTVFVEYQDGSSEPIQDGSVVWVVDDVNIAEVNEHGELRGRSRGDTTIEAFHAGISTTLEVRVFDIARRIHVRTDDNGPLPAGLGRQFTAELEYERGDREDVTALVEWTSSQTNLAAVGASGFVQGLAPGRVRIAATGFDVQGDKELEVRPAVPIQVSVAPVQAVLAVGETLQLSAVGAFSDGNVVDITETARWTSSLDAVARVNRGEVTARASGDVTITVGDDFTFALVSVRVVPAPPPQGDE